MTEPHQVDEFDVDVEQTDRGWQVVLTADGDRRHLEPVHPDEQSARFAAKNIGDGATRWEGGAEPQLREDSTD